MAADLEDRNRSAAELPAQFRAEGAAAAAGRHDLREDFPGQPELVGEFKIPLPRDRIEQIGGRAVGVFAGVVAAERAGQRIGHHQKMAVFKVFRVFAEMGRKLVDRVDDHALDSGAGVELLAGNLAPDIAFGVAGAHVAVVVGPAARLAGGVVEEDVVHAPGVDADSGDGGIDFERFGQAGFELFHQLGIVPVDRTALFGRTVGEPVHLGQREFAGFEGSDDGAAAGGPEVECEKAAHVCLLRVDGS